ncbi:aldehyde dehydrogenase family 3 member b1 [Pleurostoma richardsiae]|uniref:Aldehyde dehydrogenase family 3 member b1 n=1 Tax=Pleurostoma richardsiae TaxID=41990 RepID=A0AA38RR88_9PEZI|nr:aldehyde dehydrogenase family 3 member b1 [Pleurostoma richardsiae]
MAKPFSKVRSAAIDGRVHNPFFRKTQLKRLHDKLIDNSAEIQKVLGEDTGHRPAEIKAEYWLALRCLADTYNSIEPERDLDAEYAIANGNDAPRACEPVGIVVIEPATHAFLFGLISALAPAIAAGNCVIIRVEQTMLKAPLVILGLVEEALDQNIICTTTAKAIADADINHRHVRVLQNGSPDPPLTNHVVSPIEARVVAVVERDADLTVSAEALVGARFGLRGKSPYAPDLILVNEWVFKDFLAAAVQCSIRLATNGRMAAAGAKVSGGFADEAINSGQARLVSSAANGTVVELLDRSSAMAQPKLGERCLVLHAVASVDDAINLSNGLGRLAAAFVFTRTLGAAKYLCQFLDSDVSFVNQLPIALLFSPVAPAEKPLDIGSSTPYDLSFFTLPKPQYVLPPRQSQLLDGILLEPTPLLLAQLDDEVRARLPEVKRLKNGRDIGFFDQGVITGGILVISTVVTCASLLVYYARARWHA